MPNAPVSRVQRGKRERHDVRCRTAMTSTSTQPLGRASALTTSPVDTGCTP